MITIKHICSKCQNELMFTESDIRRKYEHLNTAVENNILVSHLSGHKFIVCPCCSELNILGDCSDTAHLNPGIITDQQELKNRYGIIALQKVDPKNSSDWYAFSNYDNDIPSSKDNPYNVINL